jgi:hypothetical protein
MWNSDPEVSHCITATHQRAIKRSTRMKYDTKIGTGATVQCLYLYIRGIAFCCKAYTTITKTNWGYLLHHTKANGMPRVNYPKLRRQGISLSLLPSFNPKHCLSTSASHNPISKLSLHYPFILPGKRIKLWISCHLQEGGKFGIVCFGVGE